MTKKDRFVLDLLEREILRHGDTDTVRRLRILVSLLRAGQPVSSEDWHKIRHRSAEASPREWAIDFIADYFMIPGCYTLVRAATGCRESAVYELTKSGDFSNALMVLEWEANIQVDCLACLMEESEG